MTTGCQMI